MKFVLLTVESNEDSWSQSAIELYFGKISHFIKIEKILVKPKRISRDFNHDKKSADSESLLSALQPEDFVILLDENGKNLSSELFARQVERILLSGKKRCIWIVGGAYGVTDQLKLKAQVTISMAPFVMNHHVAQVVLLEQIYRSFTILKNLPYHNK